MSTKTVEYTGASELLDSEIVPELAQELLEVVSEEWRLRLTPLYEAILSASAADRTRSAESNNFFEQDAISKRFIELKNCLEKAADSVSVGILDVKEVFEIVDEHIPSHYKKPGLLIDVFRFFEEDVYQFAFWFNSKGHEYENYSLRAELYGDVSLNQSFIRNILKAKHDLAPQLSHNEWERWWLVNTLIRAAFEFMKIDLNGLTEGSNSLLMEYLFKLGVDSNLEALVSHMIDDVDNALRSEGVSSTCSHNIEVIRKQWERRAQSVDWQKKALGRGVIEETCPDKALVARNQELKDAGVVGGYELLKCECPYSEDCFLKLRSIFGTEAAKDPSLFVHLVSQFECEFRHICFSCRSIEDQAHTLVSVDISVSIEGFDTQNVGRTGARSWLSLFFDELSRQWGMHGNSWQARWVIRKILSNLSVDKLVEATNRSYRNSQQELLKGIADQSVLVAACESALYQWHREQLDWDVSDGELLVLAIRTSVQRYSLADDVAEAVEKIIVSAIDLPTLDLIDPLFLEGDGFSHRLDKLQDYIGKANLQGTATDCIVSLSTMFQTLVDSPAYCFEETHPVCKLYRALADIVYPNNSEFFKNVLGDNDWLERLENSIDFIFAGYSSGDDRIANILAQDDESPLSRDREYIATSADSGAKTEYLLFPEIEPSSGGIKSLADSLFSILESGETWLIENYLTELNCLNYSAKIYAALNHLVVDREYDLFKRVHVFGAIIGKKYRNYHFEKIEEITHIYRGEFEEHVARSAELYPQYLSYCYKNNKFGLSVQAYAEDDLFRFGKCLSSLRRRIKNDRSEWRMTEYRPSLEALAQGLQFERIFTQTMLAFRVAKASSAQSAVQVQWRLSMNDLSSTTEVEIALNWLIASWLPQQCLAASKKQKEGSDAEKHFRAISILTGAMYKFCISSLKLKKKEKVNGSGYLQSQCKEQDTRWRKGLLRALGDLKLNPGGEAHKVAHFVAKNDFDPATRELARQVHGDLRLRKPYRSYRDIHCSYLAAFWRLRVARAESCAIGLDMVSVRRWGKRELRHITVVWNG